MNFSFLDLFGLSTFLIKLKNIFGNKTTLDNSETIRRQYLLEIAYDAELAFDKNRLIGEGTAPYVGQAIVGSTYVA